MEHEIAAFEREWRTGDRAKAKQMARAYVETHRPALTRQLASYTREDLVGLIEQYRATGCAEDRIIADMWLLSEYDPQQISGDLNLGAVAAAMQADLRQE